MGFVQLNWNKICFYCFSRPKFNNRVSQIEILQCTTISTSQYICRNTKSGAYIDNFTLSPTRLRITARRESTCADAAFLLVKPKDSELVHINFNASRLCIVFESPEDTKHRLSHVLCVDPDCHVPHLC